MLSQNFRYQLESRNLTGHRQQKFQCPQCGRMKCFVRYVDTQKDFAYVADEVGKCDHEHSCGYHYKPSEYFRDNQWARETGIRIESHIRPIELPPFRPLPWEYVRRSHSPHSTFWDWLTIVAAPRIGISEEALRLYQDGFNCWFNLQDIQRLEKHQEEFMVPSSEEQLVQLYFSPAKVGEPGARFIMTAEIASVISIKGGLRHDVDILKLSAIMKKLGYEKHRNGHDRKRGLIVREHTPMEIDELQDARKCRCEPCEPHEPQIL